MMLASILLTLSAQGTVPSQDCNCPSFVPAPTIILTYEQVDRLLWEIDEETYNKIKKDNGGGIEIPGVVSFGANWNEFQVNRSQCHEAMDSEERRQSKIEIRDDTKKSMEHTLLAAYKACLDHCKPLHLSASIASVTDYRIVGKEDTAEVLVKYEVPPGLQSPIEATVAVQGGNFHGLSPVRPKGKVSSTGKLSLVSGVNVFYVSRSPSIDLRISITFPGYSARAEALSRPRWMAGAWSGTLVRTHGIPQPEYWAMRLQAKTPIAIQSQVLVSFDTEAMQRSSPEMKKDVPFAVDWLNDEGATLDVASPKYKPHDFTVEIKKGANGVLFLRMKDTDSAFGDSWTLMRPELPQ